MVLISEIDINCQTVSALICYILSIPYYKKKHLCNATNDRLLGGQNTEGNWRGYTCDVMYCEKTLIISLEHYARFCLFGQVDFL